LVCYNLEQADRIVAGRNTDETDVSTPSGRLDEERGQAATEYALLVLWTVIVVMASIKALEFALFDFYEDIATLICLPVP